MLEAIVSLLIAFVLLLINLYISKDLFYPSSMFSLIWVLVILSYTLLLSNHNSFTYELDPRSLLIFLLGQVFFSVASFFAIKPLKIKREPIYPTIKGNLDKWILLFLILMLPIYINAILRVVSGSKLADVNFYLALRHEYVFNGVNLGILDYLNPISVFAFAFVQYKFNFSDLQYNRVFRFFYKLSFYLVVFTYAFLSTGRAYFVLILSIYLIFKIISKKIKKFHIISASLIFLVLFIINAFMLGKGASVDDSASENVSSISENFMIYFLGGVYGFDSKIKSGTILDYGENTFRFFIAVAHSLGLTNTKPNQLVMPYITTPIVSNVYSLYYKYFKDFGYFGLLFNVFWGYLHTSLYYRVKKRSSFLNIYFYALLMYPLLMSFFDDQYMSLLSTWIQLIFYGLLANFFIVYNTQTSTKAVNGN